MVSGKECIHSSHVLKAQFVAATEEFERKLGLIADDLNCRMLARPDLVGHIGLNKALMRDDNSRNFCRAVASHLQNYGPEVLVEVAIKAFCVSLLVGFQFGYWPANIDTQVQVLKEEIPEPVYSEVYPFFDRLIVHIPVSLQMNDTA